MQLKSRAYMTTNIISNIFESKRSPSSPVRPSAAGRGNTGTSRRRNGYIFERWKGDRRPHIHVSSARGKFLGRIHAATKQPIGTWRPGEKIVKTIIQLERRG